MSGRKPDSAKRGRAKRGSKAAPSRSFGNQGRRHAAENKQPQVTTAEPSLVQIEKPIYGGAFLARVEGKAVFVPLALPGEQVRVRIAQDKRGYATAEVEAIAAAAAERVKPGCSHFGACGGCNYQHAEYVAQLRMKQAILRETLQRGGVTAPGEMAVLAGAPWGYRNRIRVALDAQGRPGYRGRRSHALTPIAECPIAAPVLVRAAQSAAELLSEAMPGLRATEFALFCNADETDLLLTVFCAGGAAKGFEAFAQAVQQRVPALSGAELAIEGRGAEAPKTLARWGRDSLLYRVAGFDYRVDHGAFFQVNRWLVDALVERVTAGQAGTLAWDLYAGVGLFARRLTQSFANVVAVEAAPMATAALAHNLSGTGNVAVKADTLGFLRRNRHGERPELVVADPPRTGLGAEVCALLAEAGAPRLVLVSCDPATLARDLRALMDAGYAMESIALADLFPQTFHLETVVHLRKD